MRINVRFHLRFKDLFGTTQKQVELGSGANVRDLLKVLCVTENQRRGIYAEMDKRLRHDVLVTKNRRFIFHMKRLDTELEDNDEVAILYPACMG
jgi:molybdopterin converting factor small subunit